MDILISKNSNLNRVNPLSDEAKFITEDQSSDPFKDMVLDESITTPKDIDPPVKISFQSDVALGIGTCQTQNPDFFNQTDDMPGGSDFNNVIKTTEDDANSN